jgi:hypothetical protein
MKEWSSTSTALRAEYEYEYEGERGGGGAARRVSPHRHLVQGNGVDLRHSTTAFGRGARAGGKRDGSGIGHPAVLSFALSEAHPS